MENKRSQGKEGSSNKSAARTREATIEERIREGRYILEGGCTDEQVHVKVRIYTIGMENASGQTNLNGTWLPYRNTRAMMDETLLQSGLDAMKLKEGCAGASATYGQEIGGYLNFRKQIKKGKGAELEKKKRDIEVVKKNLVT